MSSSTVRLFRILLEVSALDEAVVFYTGPQMPPEFRRTERLRIENAALVDAMLARLVIARVRPATRSALVSACEASEPLDRPSVVARLILASPEYQMA